MESFHFHGTSTSQGTALRTCRVKCLGLWKLLVMQEFIQSHNFACGDLLFSFLPKFVQPTQGDILFPLDFRRPVPHFHNLIREQPELLTGQCCNRIRNFLHTVHNEILNRLIHQINAFENPVAAKSKGLAEASLDAMKTHHEFLKLLI
jgi:hypothetical protein